MNFLIKLVGNISLVQFVLTPDTIMELQFGMSKVSISKFNVEVMEIADGLRKVPKKSHSESILCKISLEIKPD